MEKIVRRRRRVIGNARVWCPARWLVIAASAGLVAACSSSGSSSPVALSTTPSSTSTSAARTTVNSTSAVNTTSATSSTSVVTTAAPATLASTTQAQTTTTTDPDVRPVPAEDMPMVDAYKAYLTAFIKAASSSPVDAEAAALAPLTTPDFVAQIRSFLKAKRDINAVLNVSLGVTPRPFVVASPRSASEVYVNDCQLDGSYWVDASGTPLPGQKAQVKRVGLLTKITLVNGSWVVAGGGEQGGACIRS